MTKKLDWAVNGPPLGLWRTVTGTFDAVMQDTLCLMPDGTGYLARRSPMHGEDKFPVKWRHPSAGTLSMAVHYPWVEPGEEPCWGIIQYCAGTVEIDAGGACVDVLRNVSDDNFWDFIGPIGFVSPPPEPSQ